MLATFKQDGEEGERVNESALIKNTIAQFIG